ncbi:hypothetical protein [Plesiomonas shigelloides]|uniref:Uncharacterized protein n=1 Tax=Plesiomonas shigelloides 302-73 TaxID=1315976 RepID=R8AVV7_PLESH|nr:hypothetical protein [Plesiomonas shigelloides]EON90477.1 hypothetical protein PLESHI_00250 [Plesiomonas shigelloides 302-73]
MITDNPAARLLAILHTGKEINPNANAKEVWAILFGLKANVDNYESILMSKLGQVMLLPHETRILVRQYYPSQVSSLTHTLNQIQRAFIEQNLSSSWNTFIKHIDMHCISTLSMTSALLDQKLQTKLIDVEELDEFKEKVKSLLSETIASNLSSEFKRFMTHYLQRIINAINDYLISGAMPILDAIESTLGHAVIDPSFRDELKDTETGTKIRSMLSDLANVVTVATAATGAVAYLASNGLKLLG